MEDFDLFTNEINYTKPYYLSVLNKFTNDIPGTPISPNYESSKKLLAEECLADNDDLACAFHLSESVSSSIRTMAQYREEQLKIASDKLHKIKSYIKPIASHNQTKKGDLLFDLPATTELLQKYEINDEKPLHMRYLRFTSDNNVDNFQKILKELPKEWTVVQLTAPYNANENLKSHDEFKLEISSITLSVFTNAYLNDDDGPFNVQIPANVHKEGEKPLFTELYSVLEDNYKTIANAQFINNKRQVQNYWSQREDIDLRMKSVINIMDREWLSGWSCLMSGRVQDEALRTRLRALVDAVVTDWGFIRLTPKQRVQLYNLTECSHALSSSQIKCCIRRILTENGNPDDIRQVLDTTNCENCSTEFNYPQELCVKCLAKCFEKIHNFSLVDGLKAFWQAMVAVREDDEWATLRKAKRYPVVLIVDEMLDTFPWESLPFLNTQSISRMENIHFLYYLYKVHESNIVDGFIQIDSMRGRYVINPEKNLDRMEQRMRVFVRRRCPQWRGHIGDKPPPTDFLLYLQDADLFLYCGHGDGWQLTAPSPSPSPSPAPHTAPPPPAPPGCIESACRCACSVLAGCASVRLQPREGREPAAASYHAYHIAKSPLVIGMLWEVTDLEVDKVVTSLLSLTVPAPPPPPAAPAPPSPPPKGGLPAVNSDKSESDMLKAITLARRSTNYIMIASSVVARGLPVRVKGLNS